MFIALCTVLLILLTSDTASAENDWPIIGVFTQPSTATVKDCGGNCMYLAASYVKYLESAGARVVPINYAATEAELDKLLANLNGFFFPGGGSAFPASAQYIFDKVVAANDAGDFTPLWGTCLGFEWLVIAATRNANILDGVLDSENYSIPLDFATDASSSKLFSNAPKKVMDILATENVTMNNHMYGIKTAHFKSTPALSSFYNILSTNKDRNGVEFVSTIEAMKYPIFGAQWHPEKNIFEWGTDLSTGLSKEAINHTPDAILIAQYATDFFVQQARKSSHKYTSAADEDAALIYNYTPTKTTTTSSSFVQEYFFHF